MRRILLTLAATILGDAGSDKIINCTTAPGCPPMGYWTSVETLQP